MAEPNGATLETQLTAADQPAAAGPMTAEERASRAFAALVAGQPAGSVRADLDREAADRVAPGEDRESPEDAGDDRRPPAAEDAPEPDDKAGEGTDDAATTDEDFLRAEAVLRRDGWTQAMIERMPREDLLAHAEKRRKVQADVDRFGSKRPDKQPPPEPDADGRDGTPPTDDTETLVSQIEEYDPDLAKRVSAVIQESRAKVQQAESTQLERSFRETVAQLSPTYPELGTDEGRAKVLARAEKLARTGDYTGPEALEQLVLHASVLEFGDRRAQQAQQDLLKRNRQTRDGQVETDAASNPETKPMTKAEKETYVFRLLGKGYTPEEARRMAAKIPDA